MNSQLSKRLVAFQGERGAFSEDAAVSILGEDIQLVPRATLESLFASVAEGVADYSLVPMENTIAGSLHRSYDLLLDASLQIVGETVIPVVHNLIGCPSANLEMIEIVESHPMALAQCENFFAANPQIERVATDDTAGSVRRVIQRGDPTRAAIAGKRAARIHGGEILREHLEDHSENYTRFFLLGKAPEGQAQGDKVSLAVKLVHQPGSLYAALKVFARRGIDLLKIESRPITGQPWQYRFYLDFKGNWEDERVLEALAELRKQTAELRVLGCYKSAEAPTSASTEG